MAKKKKRKKRKKNSRELPKNALVAAPITEPKGLEVQYRKELNKLGRALIRAVNTQLLPYLKSSQQEYVIDQVGGELSRIFASLNAQFTGGFTAAFATTTANQAVDKLDLQNRDKFNDSIASITGIDLGSIIQVEGLEDILQLSKKDNEILIKSLPQEYLKDVEIIVNKGITRGATYSTIAKEITAKVGSANSKLAGRIKTIARNEMQTINSKLNLRRSESLGITKGVYRTSEDERVRKCHEEINGVIYELAEGAWSPTCQKYIQPGITDINCRCRYSPIIEV
jgi:SPP1 gp7 family putative phage head morphogenesis protein